MWIPVLGIEGEDGSEGEDVGVGELLEKSERGAKVIEIGVDLD